MNNIRQKSKIYYQYVVQLFQNGKFKRYLRDDREQPFSFGTKGEANLFARQYLAIRNRKSFTIKVVPVKIKLPKPELSNASTKQR